MQQVDRDERGRAPQSQLREQRSLRRPKRQQQDAQRPGEGERSRDLHQMAGQGLGMGEVIGPQAAQQTCGGEGREHERTALGHGRVDQADRAHGGEHDPGHGGDHGRVGQPEARGEAAPARALAGGGQALGT
jgi:hypothetical protein